MHTKNTDWLGPNPKGEYTVVNDQGSVIGCAFPHTVLGREENAQDNAQLWAAAPKMLEICKHLAAYLDFYDDPPQKLLSQLKLIIEEAEGNTSPPHDETEIVLQKDSK